MSFPCYPLETFETWEIEENLEPAEDKHLVMVFVLFSYILQIYHLQKTQHLIFSITIFCSFFQAHILSHFSGCLGFV